MVTWETVTLVLPSAFVDYRMRLLPFVRYDICNAYVIGNTNQTKIHSQSHGSKRWGNEAKLRRLLLVS